MSLRLVVGPPNAGKTGVLAAALEAAARQHQTAILVLPEHADVERARTEFATRAPVGVRIETLAGFGESLWGLYGDGRRFVTAMARPALLRELKTAAPPELVGAARHDGFWSLLEQVVRYAAARSQTKDDGSGVLSLVERYERLLSSKGMIEPAAATRTLAGMDTLEGACIAVNHFTAFSEDHEKLLVSLANSNDVLVSLTWREGSAATEALDAFVERMRAAGAEIAEVAGEQTDDELVGLQNRLFAGGVALEPQGQTELLEASGIEAEVALVADAAARLIAEEGFTPDYIAVTFPDLDARLWLIEQAFRSRGVPVAIDIAMPFDRTGYGRALISLLRVALGSGDRTDLIAFLKSPYSGARHEAVERLDRTWRLGREGDAAKLLSDATELGAATYKAIRLARASVASTVNETSIRTWEGVASSLLENLWAGGNVDDTTARIDSGAYQKVVEAAIEVAEAGAGLYRAIDLIQALRNVRVATGTREQSGRVQVTEAHRVRSRRFDALVIAGLSADEFRSDSGARLADTIAESLGCQQRTESRLLQRQLFYSLLSRARRRLILVRQASDSTGTPMRPSLFWEEVVDAYRSAEDVLEEREPALAVSERLPIAELHRAAPAFTPGRFRQRDVGRHLDLGGPVARGVLNSSLLETGQELSVTSIESYLACPYKWFHERVLSPEELDREFGPIEKGTFAHELLRSFYHRLQSLGHPRVSFDNLAEALHEFDLVAAERGLQAQQTLRSPFEALELEKAAAWCRGVVERDASLLLGFAPQEQEWAFGGGASRPFAFAGVALKGKIDRIDVGPRGLVVTDYKSGSDVPGASSFLEKGQLQALVYSQAAAAHLGDAGVVGGLYRSLSSGSCRGFWNIGEAPPEDWVHEGDVVDASSLRALLEAAETLVGEAAEGMRRGDIPASPRDASVCRWCQSSSFCGGSR